MRGALYVVLAAAAASTLLSRNHLRMRRETDQRAVLPEAVHTPSEVSAVHQRRCHAAWDDPGRAYRMPLRLASYAEAMGGETPGAQEPHCGVTAVPSAFVASTSLHTLFDEGRETACVAPMLRLPMLTL